LCPSCRFAKGDLVVIPRAGEQLVVIRCQANCHPIGKTFLASVLAHHLCLLGHTVRYCKTHELLADLKRAKADGSFSKLRKQLLALDLLIWDEWLRDPLSVPDARLALDLIDDRYRRQSCLFVTQLPVESWHPQIQDATLADAILDRIVHDAIRVPLKGESMRKLTSPLKADATNDSCPYSASLDTSSENRDAKD
jgi:DNA replication protein DnaC